MIFLFDIDTRYSYAIFIATHGIYIKNLFIGSRLIISPQFSHQCRWCPPAKPLCQCSCIARIDENFGYVSQIRGMNARNASSTNVEKALGLFYKTKSLSICLPPVLQSSKTNSRPNNQHNSWTFLPSTHPSSSHSTHSIPPIRVVFEMSDYNCNVT